MVRLAPFADATGTGAAPVQYCCEKDGASHLRVSLRTACRKPRLVKAGDDLVKTAAFLNSSYDEFYCFSALLVHFISPLWIARTLTTNMTTNSSNCFASGASGLIAGS